MLKTSSPPRLCASQGCGNKARKHQHHCTSCSSRKQREKDPEKYVYFNVRTNAHSRGIKFSLTLEWFISWVRGTEYMQKRGRGAEDLTLDRIRPQLGYADENLQVLTNRQNSAKRWTDQRKTQEEWGTPF